MAELENNNSRQVTGLVQTNSDPDPVDILLQYMRSGFRGLIGSPFNFCRALCAITDGMSGSRANSLTYGWYTLGGQKKDILTFRGNGAYEIICELNGEITMLSIDHHDFQRLKGRLSLHPLSVMISKFEMAKEFKAAVELYRKKQLDERQRSEAEKIRAEQEDTIETVLRRIDKIPSDDPIVLIKGIKNIHALIEQGYVPGICDNPDLWVDAEDFASLYYKRRETGEEILLIGREKLQAITELSRIEYKFLVVKCKDKPGEFREKFLKFNRPKMYAPPRNWSEEFFQGLSVLTTYPEELKNRTVADLDVMAKVIDGVIVERSQIEEGLIPFDALFKKETRRILVDVLTAKKPLPEIRKSLDYLEHTGMVQPVYKDSLFELLKMEAAGIVLYDHLARQDQEKTLAFIQQLPTHHTIDLRKILEGIEIKAVSENQQFKEYIYTNGAVSSTEIHKKRIKQIVTMVLKSIPGEVNAENITIAMQPYIEELGLDELDRIKKRILELKAVVASQLARP